MPQTTTKSGAQTKEQVKPEETKPETLLNQLIGKSVVRVDDADFRYTVIQVRPFKSETSS